MLFTKKVKRPRTPADLLRERVQKNHPDETPRRIAAIIERVREIDHEIRER